MEIKDTLLYALCVPSAIYSIYEGAKLFEYIGYIKEHNSACY
jgi:hypothetical protein